MPAWTRAAREASVDFEYAVEVAHVEGDGAAVALRARRFDAADDARPAAVGREAHALRFTETNELEDLVFGLGVRDVVRRVLVLAVNRANDVAKCLAVAVGEPIGFGVGTERVERIWSAKRGGRISMSSMRGAGVSSNPSRPNRALRNSSITSTISGSGPSPS